MKKKIFLSAATLLALGVLAGCGGGGGGGQSQTPSVTPPSVTPPSVDPSVEPSSQGGGDIDVGNILVWCDRMVKDVTDSQIRGFMAANPQYNMTYSIVEASEADAATHMAEDPENGADVYFFAQDQLARLVGAGALNSLTTAASNVVKELNDDGSILAATFNDKLYAYPATSDNGFFMYYDKEVLQGVDLNDLDAIAAAVKAAGKTISYNYGSGWYNAAFFFAYGCHPTLYTTEGDSFTAYEDDYNSVNGIEAATALKRYISDTALFIDSSEAASFNQGAAVVVSGTWDASVAKQYKGENLGVAKLPSVRSSDEAPLVQLSSFIGNKLVGTKIQGTRERAQAVRELALWLTNEQSQRERFVSNNWGPSNKALQHDPDIATDPILAAMWEQNSYGKPQGQFPNSWWPLSGGVGTALAADGDPATLLQSYENQLPFTLG